MINASIRWQKQEREVIKDLAVNHGFEIEEKGVDRPHLSRLVNIKGLV